nr:unnamed protein product [Digitaria exilis]
MSITRAHLGNGGVCSTQLLKIDGYNNRISGKGFLSSMCLVDGYEWKIRFSYPYEVDYNNHRIALVLFFLGDGENGVRAAGDELPAGGSKRHRRAITGEDKRGLV